MIKLTIPVPPSVNQAYGNRRGKGRGRYKTKAYTNWETEAVIALRGQPFVQAQKDAPPVSISYTVPVNRRRDIGNYEKLLSDLLVSVRVIWDDRSRYLRHITICEGAERSDVLVEIREFDE